MAIILNPIIISAYPHYASGIHASVHVESSFNYRSLNILIESFSQLTTAGIVVVMMMFVLSSSDVERRRGGGVKRNLKGGGGGADC